MKKTPTIIALILACIICFFLGAPSFQGIQIEKRIRKSIYKLDRAFGTGVSTRIIKYDRGWFRSEIKVGIVYEPALGEEVELIIPGNIIHGPFPVIEILKGRMPIKFFDAFVLSEFTPRFSNPVLKQALSKSLSPLANLKVVFIDDDTVELTITSPELPSATPNLDWKGGNFTLYANEKNEILKTNLSLRGFSYDNGASHLQIKLGDSHWKFEVKDSFSSIKTSFNLDSFLLSSKNYQYEMSALKGTSTQRKGKNGTLIGTGAISADLVQIIQPSLDWDWKINGVLLHEASDLENIQYWLQFQGRIRKLTSANIDYGPIGLSAKLSQLNSREIPQFIDRLVSWKKIDRKADKELQREAENEFMQSVKDLSSLSPRLESQINLKKGTQRAKVGIHAVIDSNKIGDIQSVTKISRAVFGNIILRVHRELFALLWKHGFASYAKSYSSKKYNSIDKIEPVMDSHLRALLDTKLILEDKNDNFISRIDLDYGNLKINSLPFDFLRILADLSARKPSIVDISWGTLGVRGELENDRVLSAIQAKTQDFKQCVHDEMAAGKKHPRGTLHVKWDISKEGNTLEPRLTYTTVVDPSLEACVLSVFQKLTFPTSNRKSNAVIAIGFALGDILKPVKGIKLGMSHHYKSPISPNSQYKVK